MSDLPTLTGGQSKTLEANTDYTGEITDVDVRSTDRWGDYLDVEVTPDGPDAQLTPGYAIPEDRLTGGHDLGKLVERLTGERIEVGEEYNLNEIVTEGTRVAVRTEEGDEGYVNAIKDSLRPVGQEYDAEQSEDADEAGEEEQEGISQRLQNALFEADTPAPEMAIVGFLSQNGYQDQVDEFSQAVEAGDLPIDEDGNVYAPGEA